ncbi:MAG: RNA polymerase sigma factor [Acidobacteriota bacterium]
MKTPDDERRDRELLSRLAAGDTAALAELYDRHVGALLRHAVALTRQTAEAEDLVHGAIVKLAGVGAPLLGVRHPAGYLHRILRLTWIDGLRQTVRRGEDPLVDDIAVTDTVDLGAALDVRCAMERLSAPQREVVVLHLFTGFTFKEVGHIVGVPTFTAASRYRLAVERLRHLLGTAR